MLCWLSHLCHLLFHLENFWIKSLGCRVPRFHTMWMALTWDFWFWFVTWQIPVPNTEIIPATFVDQGGVNFLNYFCSTKESRTTICNHLILSQPNKVADYEYLEENILCRDLCIVRVVWLSRSLETEFFFVCRIFRGQLGIFFGWKASLFMRKNFPVCILCWGLPVNDWNMSQLGIRTLEWLFSFSFYRIFVEHDLISFLSSPKNLMSMFSA